ncbi:MAG: helix-turn-helix domain-containing protein [Acutalibacter sp.]|nr:helix-turn-helix domain-containing protein [Acutalibacter sp.]
MATGQIIRELRISHNLTQKALSEATGIPIRTLINYENTDREPNAKNMAILEQYFNVSAAYLRGESADRSRPAAWEDAEIMEAVRESLPKQLAGLNDLLKECAASDQKHTFDILVELGHILKIKDTSQRAAAMELIQAVFAATTRCIDVCAGAGEDIDPETRPQQARDTAMKSYAEALQKAFFTPQ